MSSRDIEDRFRTAREAQNAGDNGPFLGLMDSEVMWWDTGIDDPLIGREEVAARLDDLAEFRIQAEIHDVFANSEHLVALIHAEAKGEDGPFRYSTAEVYHLTNEGLITKRQAFAHDTSKIADFFRRA